jgi:lysozyme
VLFPTNGVSYVADGLGQRRTDAMRDLRGVFGPSFFAALIFTFATSARADDAHPTDDREMGDGLAIYEAEAALRAAESDPSGVRSIDELHDSLDPLAATCADGSTLSGIDVSKWQGDVNWTKVAQSGVKFAFVRVSHGVNTIDQWFESNWQEAHEAGLHVGAYQYFEPGQSADAQADIMIEKIGTLQPGDLPPVIDVESHGNLSATQVAAAVTKWVQRVEAATGVKPIIYTGRFFWQDYVKTQAFASYPLWIAHYTNNCPNLPSQWSDWAFHQYTDKGTVSGVSGPTDMNRFNGDANALLGFAIGGDVDEPDEPDEPMPAGCGVIAPDGTTVVDNGDECYVFHGPSQWWRTVNGVGIDGDVVWTGTTKTTTTNWAEVVLDFEESGIYRVEANIPKPHNTSKQAKYRIQHANGLATVVANQSTKNGWTNLGDYAFDAGTGQFVSLADATGEANSLGRRVVFDAFRFTLIGEDGRQAGGDGDGLGQSDAERGQGEQTCSVDRSNDARMLWAFALLVAGVTCRRRR